MGGVKRKGPAKQTIHKMTCHACSVASVGAGCCIGRTGDDGQHEKAQPLGQHHPVLELHWVLLALSVCLAGCACGLGVGHVD